MAEYFVTQACAHNSRRCTQIIAQLLYITLLVIKYCVVLFYRLINLLNDEVTALYKLHTCKIICLFK